MTPLWPPLELLLECKWFCTFPDCIVIVALQSMTSKVIWSKIRSKKVFAVDQIAWRHIQESVRYLQGQRPEQPAPKFNFFGSYLFLHRIVLPATCVHYFPSFHYASPRRVWQSSLWSPMRLRALRFPLSPLLLQAEQTHLHLLDVCHVPQPLLILAALHILQKLLFICYNTAEDILNEPSQYIEFWQPGREHTRKWHRRSNDFLFTFLF